MMSGDSICQTLIEKQKPFDKERVLRFGIFGLLVQVIFLNNLTHFICSHVIVHFCQVLCQFNIKFSKNERSPLFSLNSKFLSLFLLMKAPIVRGWYKSLDKMFPLNTKTSAIKKLVCDQLFFGPFIQMTALVSLEFMKSKSYLMVKENYKRNYLDLMLNALKFWPFVQTVNFFLIPLKFRVLFGSVAALFWNIYLSWKINQ